MTTRRSGDRSHRTCADEEREQADMSVVGLERGQVLPAPKYFQFHIPTGVDFGSGALTYCISLWPRFVNLELILNHLVQPCADGWHVSRPVSRTRYVRPKPSIHVRRRTTRRALGMRDCGLQRTGPSEARTTD
jgi:hypothetical protein